MQQNQSQDASVATKESEQSGGADFPEQGEAGERIFTDPVLEQAVTEDPLFVFLKKYWRTVVVCLLVVVAGVLGRRAFEQTYDASMRRSADLYQNVRQAYSEYQQVAQRQQTLSTQVEIADDSERTDLQAKLKEADEELAGAESTLKQMITALGDAKAPYSDFAHAYDGLFALQRGDMEQAQRDLALLDWKNLDVSDARRVVGEVLDLSIAGELASEEQSRSDGLAQLKMLAEQAEYVAAAAAVRYVHLAEGTEGEKESQALLQAVQARQPQQSDILDDLLSDLG
jgi:hypothetical protein